MENCIQKNTCRICGSSKLFLALDLGIMPLANAFLKQDELDFKESSFPLAIYFCENCSLVQLSHVVPGDVIFKNYHYATSASRPLVEHFHTFADEVAKEIVTDGNDLVIEIGSNDGSLLSRIKDRCRVLGVDPAENIAPLAEKNGVPTIIDFFTTSLAKKIKIEHGETKAVIGNNVMAHIDDIRDVFTGVKELLSEDGRFIFEVHWVGNLINDGGFDQIYHEHLCYYSLHSIKHLLDSLGMALLDVKIVPIHGESLRVYAGVLGTPSKTVGDFLEREKKMGLTDKTAFMNFKAKVERGKEKLLELLRGLKREGKKIVGYGAPAKGNTMLNYYQIGPSIIDYLTDTTPLKHGLYSPGMRIPIVSPEKLYADVPDYVLLLAWNYKDAILQKEKELRAKGVKFIVAVPDVEVI